jgi:hypothetical protein
VKYVIGAAILALGYLFVPAPAAHAVDFCLIYKSMGADDQYAKCEAQQNAAATCTYGTQEDQITCCSDSTFCTNKK